MSFLFLKMDNKILQMTKSTSLLILGMNVKFFEWPIDKPSIFIEKQ
jgi:hypothetical protein